MRERLAAQTGKVMGIFRQCDKDGDGKIGKAEFRQGVKLPGLGMDDVHPSQVDDLFDSIDKDRSGFITFRELNKILRRETGPQPQIVEEKPEVVEVIEQPYDLDRLRKKMKLEALKLGARSKLRSNMMPDDEWRRLGFTVHGEDSDSESVASSEDSFSIYGRHAARTPSPPVA